MSGRDPIDVIAAATRKSKAHSETRHIAKAKALAGLFARIGTELEKGRVSRARDLSHRAHALLHILGALDAQDKYPELRSPRCREKQEASEEWKALVKPGKRTLERLQEHYIGRPYAFVRLAPASPPRPPVPKVPYRGGIYETVFSTDDPRAAQLAGLDASYMFRHGVTAGGYHPSLYSAIERKIPGLLRDRKVPARMHVVFRWDEAGNTYDFCELHVTPNRESSRRVFVYRVDSTTHAEAAKQLAARRAGR